MKNTKSGMICLFRVELDSDFKGRRQQKPLRELAILETQSLSTLARAVVTSFGFYFDHCYGYYGNPRDHYRSKEIYELFADLPEVEHTPGALGVTYTRVGKVFPSVGKKMRFLFDYGDNWLFTIELIDKKPLVRKTKYPRILKSVGKAPEQYPPIEEDGLNEGDWFHEDCSLCRALKKAEVEMQWFPDEW